MITVNNLSVEFNARPLFADVSFVINPKDRVALVGKNGAGKSTLLKILCGKQSPTTGTVSAGKDDTIGYLPQVMQLQDGHTVMEETMTAFSAVESLRDEVERLRHELTQRQDHESEDYMKLVERFTHENERLQLLGSEGGRAEAERTLTGLGFKAEEFERPTAELSGGWRMRIELAKILLQRPDILLLDEPTNHLDIESIRWLENFLVKSPSAVLLVSHDRAFINRVTNRTMEISCGKITDYKVGYDDYVRLRHERREQQLRAYENQQREIAEMKDFIERFRYKPTKAVQVQNRIKQLAKIVPIEVDEVDNSALHLKFPPCSRSGDYPVICEDLTKFYDDHCVLRNVNLTIKRGEKVAFVGRNGEGKSTWVKCLMGETDFSGTLKLGHGVEIGYYAQNQAQLLDGELTVFDTIDRVATGDIRTKIRDILGAFMFGGEASDKKVKVLSGGERSRLAMIRLLLEPVNFLILDEPTNHLDMRTKDVLKEALTAFDGTVIVVSHDRDFLKGLVSKVYEFGGGNIREHIGGIEDFLLDKDREENAARPETLAAPKPTEEKPAEASEGKRSYEERKELARLKRKAEKEVSQLEEKVTALETQKAEIEEELATPEGAANTELYTRYTALQQEIRETEARWEEALTALEENFPD
ncbi:MAG: ATP-binding cassette domain-containing protein [Alloprevotella sp.]